MNATRLFVIVAPLLSISVAAAAEPLPRLGRDMPYSSARARLVSQGWRPAPPAVSAQECGSGRDDMCRTDRPEVKSCAGTGLGQCLTEWRKGGTVIEVVTVGDERPTVGRVRCKSGCR